MGRDAPLRSGPAAVALAAPGEQEPVGPRVVSPRGAEPLRAGGEEAAAAGSQAAASEARAALRETLSLGRGRGVLKADPRGPGTRGFVQSLPWRTATEPGGRLRLRGGRRQAFARMRGFAPSRAEGSFGGYRLGVTGSR